MLGGKCMCIPSIVTGHKGRTKEAPVPFKCFASEGFRNEMVIAYLCVPESYEKLVKCWDKQRDGNVGWKNAKGQFELSRFQLDLLRKDFEKDKIMSFADFDANINLLFRKKIGKIKNEIVTGSD
jgi:hypothetical protein